MMECCIILPFYLIVRLLDDVLNKEGNGCICLVRLLLTFEDIPFGEYAPQITGRSKKPLMR